MLIDYHLKVDEKKANELVAFLKTLDYVELEEEKPKKTKKKKEPDFAYFDSCPDWDIDATELRKTKQSADKSKMVIADTDILIASFRKNDIAKQLIRKYAPQLNITVVTEMELYAGAKTPDKKISVEDVLKAHEVISLSKVIGETALRLMKEYNNRSRSLYLADALIAATCLEHKAKLLTFNTKDFKFIKGLKLAK